MICVIPGNEVQLLFALMLKSFLHWPVGRRPSKSVSEFFGWTGTWLVRWELVSRDHHAGDSGGLLPAGLGHWPQVFSGNRAKRTRVFKREKHKWAHTGISTLKLGLQRFSEYISKRLTFTSYLKILSVNNSNTITYLLSLTTCKIILEVLGP